MPGKVSRLSPRTVVNHVDKCLNNSPGPHPDWAGPMCLKNRRTQMTDALPERGRIAAILVSPTMDWQTP